MDLLEHGSDTETQHHTVVSGGGTTRIGDGNKTERIFILKNVLTSSNYLILIIQGIMDERIPTIALLQYHRCYRYQPLCSHEVVWI